MNYEEMFSIVKNLEFDKEKTICRVKDVGLFIKRPSKVSKRFKNYDIEKNFQIWLRKPGRKFRPNHLRVFIDLNLRIRSRPNMKKELLKIFDNIFYGSDPNKEIEKIRDINFEHFLNDIKIIANMAQLFLIEQDYCYNKESNFDPPTLFLQGWIREFIDSPKEIDNMCMSVANRQPPKVEYTKKENKKHKDYEEGLEKLWYLNN